MEQPAISFKNKFEFLLNADIKVTGFYVLAFGCLYIYLELSAFSVFFQLIFPAFQTMITEAPPSMESD